MTLGAPSASMIFLRVARGAADVAFRLHRGRGVDIGDDRHAGMARPHQADVRGGDRGGERAAGSSIGDQHGLFGVQQLRRLGHEMHAGQDDDRGVGARRLARQREAVADDVADGVEDVGGLIVVRQDDRVPLALQLEDRGDVLGEERPFEGRHVALDPAVELGQRHRGTRDGGVTVSSTRGSISYAPYEHLEGPEKPDGIPSGQRPLERAYAGYEYKGETAASTPRAPRPRMADRRGDQLAARLPARRRRPGAGRSSRTSRRKRTRRAGRPPVCGAHLRRSPRPGPAARRDGGNSACAAARRRAPRPCAAAAAG